MEVPLTNEQKRELRVVAERLNVEPAELAAAVIRDFLGRMGADFEKVAKRVLKKNHELYRRLS